MNGQGKQKIITPSNIFDIYTRHEVLLAIKISGHSDTLAESSNLMDELYKRVEKQNQQQYRNALSKFSIIQTYNYPSNYTTDEYIHFHLYFFINKKLCDIKLYE